MKRNFLGDSYDAVKRLWQQIFAAFAPLYAEPRFIPLELQSDFTLLTGIPILTTQPPADFSVLNDPDTGIRLPGEDNQAEGQTHTTIRAICRQLQQHTPLCVVTYDQSHYRHIKLKADEQRQAKLRRLSGNGAFGYYYVSHAPFLFAFQTREALQETKNRLLRFGIPKDRLETLKVEA